MKEEEIVENILSFNKKGEFAIEKITPIHEDEDIILYELERKNKQRLCCIAFRKSLSYDSWFWVVLTENQAKILSEMKDLIAQYNKLNNKEHVSEKITPFEIEKKRLEHGF